MKTLTNRSAVPDVIRFQLDDAIQRALAVGASAPLTYMGAGATGIVFCDWKGHGYKVYRWRADWAFPGQEAEAEWLMLASTLPELVGLVPMNVEWFPKEQVLARDCIDGWPAGWGSKGVREAYEHVKTAMWPHGWGAPEFKEDSFIITRDGRLVLVDAGAVLRYGENLLNYTREVLAGERHNPEPGQDLIYAIRLGIMDGQVPRDEGERLLALLGDTELSPRKLDGLDASIACGDCFRFATQWKAPFNQEGVVVVHGTVVEPLSPNPKRFTHAWVEWNGKAFDWQTQATKPNGIPLETFYELWKAEPQKWYSSDDALELAVRTRHWGPW